MSENAAADRDPENMLGHVQAWPELLVRGFGQTVEVPGLARGKRRIVCCGMGGSAIGAGLVGDYGAQDFTVPYEVTRDYTLPGGVDADTLVLCLSYSGDTEETLSCFEAAREAGAALMAVTTGGELAVRGREAGIPVITFDYRSQPRAALPVMLGLLLKLFSIAGYLPDQAKAVGVAQTAAAAATKDQASAERLAGELAGRIPIVYGSGLTAEAARRLKGQVSENANQTAAWEVLPEQNHNALVGLEQPDGLAAMTRFVLLRTDQEHPRNTLRFEILKELLEGKGLACSEIRAAGDGRLAQLVSVLAQGDLASVALAFRNGVDPTPVTVIAGLKERLGEAS